jgi:hypothetical protein
MAAAYPVPVKSCGTLTIEFNINNDTSNNDEENHIVPIKGTVYDIQRKEDVNVVLS